MHEWKPLKSECMNSYSKKSGQPFGDVVAEITQSLQKQGFGIITTIDMKETLKQKLDIDFRNYKILGACNPQFAHKALSIDPSVGVMLPCNVVVQQHAGGEVEVSAVNPVETLGKEATALKEVAAEVGKRLQAAVEAIH